MGFKLGTRKGNYAVSGEIKTKMRFHQEDGDPDLSVPGTPIIRKDLAPGILGEANADGSIYISNEIEPGSPEETQTLLHEMTHATAMKISPNKQGYHDDYMMYEGREYPRKTIKGKDMIMDIDTGEWKQAGDQNWPWEIEAETFG